MRKKYSYEFKIEAVRLWQTSEKAAREIEDELGLTRGRLYEWRYRLKVTDERSTVGQPGKLSTKAEIRQLQRELEIVQQERDILKKAVAIFSQPSK
jgi:transposase